MYISIVMPVKGEGKYIQEAISSVENQGYKNWEFIIVDDGMDSKLKEEILKNQRWIRVLESKGSGISAALNTGIEAAKYDYIARIDDDDIWASFHLELLVSVLKRYTRLELVSTMFDMASVPQTLPRQIMLNNPYMELSKRNPITHPAVIFKKELWQKAGGYRSEHDGHEDYDLWTRIITPRNAVICMVASIFYRSGVEKYKKVQSQKDESVKLESSEKLALLMCQTPLQAVIAEKIVKENKDKKFFLVYAPYEWGNKHEYYSKRLMDLCGSGVRKRLSDRTILVNLVEEISSLDFDEMYMASIDAPLSHGILSKKEGVKLCTYDDGAANIVSNSIYFTETKASEDLDIEITWDKERVKSESKKHYTIFDSKFNIVPSEKLVKVDLFDFESPREREETGKEVSVLLGQTIINPDRNELYMRKVVVENNIDYYFPHPREGELRLLNDKIISTDLIFEEYFLELLKEYDKVHVYHFFSTAVINLRKHSRLIEHIVNKKLYDHFAENFKNKN